jgi:hypothetical protein
MAVDDLPPPARLAFNDAPTGEIPIPNSDAPTAAMSGISAMALSSDPDAQEHVWRMLDMEVAQNKLADPTGETPAPRNPFHIDDEDLR